jgi:hypothetical protein
MEGPVKYTRLARSWEKQTWYRLENGWTAVVEYNPSYGEFVKALLGPGVDDPCGKDGPVWLACNGRPPSLGAAHYNAILKTTRYVDLPAFAAPWRSPDWHGLVWPDFLRQ